MATFPVLQRSVQRLFDCRVSSWGATASQVCVRWGCWVTRDVRRRQTVAKHAPKRLRLKSIAECRLLPEELRQRAARELHEMPRDGSITRIRNRCVLTGRPRGVLTDFRLCRHAFRRLADSSQLPGITRSSW
ncbi:small ribosomal subunit protein uS14-like [Corticium candelabrum]|uniref:small ribosomal subunit protein uS14-like n=1 Tax=Corticium candelabrum TaxID=121492 RepID=UPI002E25AA21|nr:small ribosomal subunit protein uS14-like [Corticium candelabrum]